MYTYKVSDPVYVRRVDGSVAAGEVTPSDQHDNDDPSILVVSVDGVPCGFSARTGRLVWLNAGKGVPAIQGPTPDVVSVLTWRDSQAYSALHSLAADAARLRRDAERLTLNLSLIRDAQIDDETVDDELVSVQAMRDIATAARLLGSLCR